MKNILKKVENNWQLLILLSLGLILRILLASQGTLWLDLNSWIAWSNRLVTVPFSSFYDTWSDYLPGFLYVLAILGKIKLILASINILVPNYLLFKLPSILADLITGWLIYKTVRFLGNQKMALVASVVYIFNPAVFANSTLWGQADSFASLFLVLSCWFLAQKKWLATTLALGLAGLIKPNGLFLVPAIIIFLTNYVSWRQILAYIIILGSLFLAAFIPFAGNNNFFLFSWHRLQVILGQYPYATLNAFNLWALLDLNWKSDHFFAWSGWLIFAILYVPYLFYLKKKVMDFRTRLLKLVSVATLIYFSAFLFLTRMHERHLFPVLPFLTIIMFSYDLWLTYILVSCLYILNLRYAYVWLTQNFASILSQPVIQLLSFVYLGSFVYLVLRVIMGINPLKKLSLKINIINWFKSFLTNSDQFKPETVKRKNLILAGILLFAFATRIINLGYPQSYIFDEVYHAFTAQEIIKGNVMAWEWWNTPPQGFAYEWTHPPLGKLIMVAGIFLGRHLGIANDFFSWRFPAVIFGVGVIFLTYKLAKQILRSEKIALLTAFLLSCEGLTLVMSRVGMIDIYVLFFLLLTIILALKQKWFLTAIFWGVSIATKWTGIYLLPVILFIFLFQNNSKNKVNKTLSLLFMLILPIFIYLFAYLPFFTSGHTPKQFIELQEQMWWYHTRLKATHNYQSTPLTWPFDLRPVWFYVNYQKSSTGNIYALGNPLIFWSGLIVLPLFVWDLILKKSKKIFLVLLCYFIFWLPWIFSPRIMFLYHYLPSLPFLAMILAWELDSLTKLTNRKIFFTFYFLLFTLSFAFFYPLWTGILIPNNLLKFWFWLPTWK